MKKLTSAIILVLFTMGMVMGMPDGDKTTKAKAAKKGSSCTLKANKASKMDHSKCDHDNGKCEMKNAAKASADVK